MGSKANDICGNCSDKLPKSGDHALCVSCKYGFHLDKCSIKKHTWVSMGINKQASWLCANCRKNKKSTNSQVEEEDNVFDPSQEEDLEVSSLGIQRSILAKVNSLMGMKDKLDSIENSMKFMSDKYEEILNEVVQLRAENKAMKAEINSLKDREKSHKETTTQLSTDLADLDQYGRRFNLEIQGVKIVGDPRQEVISEVLEKIANDIDVEFKPSEIHQAHRLQARRDGKPPTIIIQYFSKTTRDLWLQHGRKSKLSNIYFNENLSPYYRQLLRETKLRAKTHQYRFVWFSGGRILVKKSETSNDVLLIKTYEDLSKIK